MEMMMLHRGRLIDHLQLVVEDYPGNMPPTTACLRQTWGGSRGLV